MTEFSPELSGTAFEDWGQNEFPNKVSQLHSFLRAL